MTQTPLERARARIQKLRESRDSADSEIDRRNDPLGLEGRRGTAVLLDPSSPQGRRHTIDHTEAAKGARDSALYSGVSRVRDVMSLTREKDFLVSNDDNANDTPRYRRRALASDPLLPEAMRERSQQPSRATSPTGPRLRAPAGEESSNGLVTGRYRRQRQKKAEESALELLDENLERRQGARSQDSLPERSTTRQLPGDEQKQKKRKRVRKKKDADENDADDEKEDPFKEFRDLAEQAEMDMITNYVARMKWKPMANCQKEETARFPEQEGFYVGEPPQVYSWNLKKIERRIRWTEKNHGEKWFGPDQKLAIAPDPLRYRMYRPGASRPTPVPLAAPDYDPLGSLMKQLQVAEDPEPVNIKESNPHQIVLRKALPSSNFRPIMDSADGTYLLVVRLGNITFLDHPLMTEEIKIAREIENWINMLKSRKRVNVVGFLTQKLEALKKGYKDYIQKTEAMLNPIPATMEPDSLDSIYSAKPVSTNYYAKHLADRDREQRDALGRNDESRRKEFRKDIRATRLLRDTESQVDRLLEFKILEGWDKIKKIREATGTVTSQLRVRVRIKEATITEEEELDILERDLLDELDELREIHHQEMQDRWRSYNLAVEEAQRRKEEKEIEERLRLEAASQEMKQSEENLEEPEQTDQYFSNEDLADDSDWRKRAAETTEVADRGLRSKKATKGSKMDKKGFSDGAETATNSEPAGRRSSGLPPPVPSSPVPRRPQSATRRLASRASSPGRSPTRTVNSDAESRGRARRSSSKQFDFEPKGEIHSAESSRSNLTILNSPSPTNRVSRRRPNGLFDFGNGEVTERFGSDETLNSEAAAEKKKRRGSKKDGNSFGGRKSSKARRKSSIARSSGPLLGSQDQLPPKPEVEEFDEAAARDQIIERMRTSRKPPGSPFLSINHVYSETITEMALCSKGEQARRRQVQETYLYARFYYNDKEVTRTLPRQIDPEKFMMAFCGINAQHPGDFAALEENGKRIRVEEATMFGIRVKEIPESIKIAIYETNVMGEMLLSEVYLGIPEPSETAKIQDHRATVLNFVGKPFSRQNVVTRLADTNLWTTGELKIHSVWGVDEMGHSLGPPLKLLDANDPQNAGLVQLKELVEKGVDHGLSFYDYWTQRQFFRLGIPIKLAEACFGVGLKDSTMTKRLCLLNARYQNKVVVTGPIPFRDEEIHDGMYEKIIDPTAEPEAIQNVWSLATPFSSLETLESDDTPIQPTQDQSTSLRFLKRIRTNQLIHRARQTRPKRVEDFVREERLAEAPPQQNFIFNFFNPIRPLKPTRTSRNSRATAQPENGCFIAVQVQRAFNIPIRKQDVKFDDAAERDRGMYEPVSVRSYLEISFQRVKVRTNVVEGPNPQWNETLSLEVKAPNNDFRPENLLDNDVGMEMVYFNLFDEIMVDMVRDDREKDNVIHQRRERNWLGGFSLPFTSVYEQTRVEGTFRVKIPPVLMSYEKNPLSGPVENSMLLAADPTSETILHLFITLEPPLLQPPPMHLKFQSDESHRLLQSSSQFSTTFPASRKISATSLDLDGRTQFITRFIRPQEPPPDMPTTRHIQRYVSHVPVVASRTALAADIWLWCTTDQVLELGAGDVVEHAIMLCNFLSHPAGGGLVARIVMGWGVPEGRTAYVAVWEKDRVSLLNSVTGESYDSKEPHLPLREVWSVFDADNVWGNIQQYTDPNRINWNLTDPKAWRAFFGPRFPKMELKSLQSEALHFKEVSNKYCKNLEHKIETAVASKMEEWRGHRVTRWNRLCSKSFKSLVNRLESDHLTCTPTPFTSALLPLRNVYRISGFPLHAVYTDVESIVEMVHATDVHANSDPGVEFALAFN
ncbi:Coiled-coil and C2 domain-containing protein 2A [Dinochytrium kinnereticum]|nr:Coiled-coil and C2 domain-containing protein 2A [Dinochytrium kinnereticum]